MKPFFTSIVLLFTSWLILFAGAGAGYEISHEAAEETSGSGIFGTLLMFGFIWLIGTIWQKLSSHGDEDKKDAHTTHATSDQYHYHDYDDDRYMIDDPFEGRMSDYLDDVNFYDTRDYDGY